MIDFTDIVLLMLLIVFITIAWQTVAVREYAVMAVKQHLRRLELQLLEDAVVWQGFSWNNKRLLRAYQFEFSSMGDERYTGVIKLAGFRVQTIELEAYRVPPPLFEQLH